jgi:hypothetical protein
MYVNNQFLVKSLTSTKLHGVNNMYDMYILLTHAILHLHQSGALLPTMTHNLKILKTCMRGL